MITVECPLCEGDATVSDTRAAVSCEGCGVRIEVAPEPASPIELAA